MANSNSPTDNASTPEASRQAQGQYQNFTPVQRLGFGKTMGILAVALAAVNVFGGFLVTRRMLEMFKKKAPKAKEEVRK